MTCNLCGEPTLPAASVCGTCFVRLFDGTVGRAFGYGRAVSTGTQRRVSMARKRRALRNGAPSRIRRAKEISKLNQAEGYHGGRS